MIAAGLFCFSDQIDNDLVNYDYADNEDIDPEDSCEVNANISNVNIEIDEAWRDAMLVPIETSITIAAQTQILTNDVLFNLELSEFDDEYTQISVLPLQDLSISLG